MTFRLRLGFGLLVAAVAPVLLLGIGVRHEMVRRLTREADRRVAVLAEGGARNVAALETDLEGRLDGLVQAVVGDNLFRLALAGDTRALRQVIDWAEPAMQASGMAFLAVLDDEGRILTSGHFRNEYGRIDPGLVPLLGATNSRAVLLRSRAPEGPFLALISGRSVRLAGRELHLAGGLALDSTRVAALGPGTDPGLWLATDAPPCDLQVPSLQSARVPLGSCRPAEARPAVRRILGDAYAASIVAEAELVFLRDPGVVAAVTRGVDRWLVTVAAAAGLLALALAAWLATRLARPIAQLAEKTARLDLDRLDETFSIDRRDEVGRLAGFLDAMTTRLRASAVQLREAERRAATGDLARQVNHDVKNGLIPIRNVLRHLTEVARADPAELPRIFDERRPTLESSVEYLESLARSYARLAPDATRSTADVNRLLTELAGTVPAPITVSLLLDEPPPLVRGDPVALRRVLENLIRNAVDASANGTGRLTLKSARDGSLVRLVVEDAGRGMARAELDRAFDDFFTTKKDGTGLGLSVVRRLVADLGGSLRVDTAPGAGTRVTLEVPLA